MSLTTAKVGFRGSRTLRNIGDVAAVSKDFDSILASAGSLHIIKSIDLGVNLNSPMGVKTEQSGHLRSLSSLLESSDDVEVTTSGDEVLKLGLEQPRRFGGG
jgi:hypothetical protein